MGQQLVQNRPYDADDEFKTELIDVTRSLQSYARRLTGGGADADDLLQDTLLRCWAARASFTTGTNMAAWSRTVMKNSFLSGLRRTRFQQDLSVEALDRLLDVPENQSAVVDLGDVDRALTELNPGQRDAVVLASQGMTIEDAAAQLAIEPGTYKSRLWRGRERLRRLTEDRDAPRSTDMRIVDPEPAAHPTTRKRRNWKGVMIG